MKRYSDWGSITIVAETDQDVEILEKLIEVLPKEAEEFYDDGEIETYRKGDVLHMEKIEKLALVIFR